MHTYYRGPDAIVTDGHFVWRTDPPQAFVITELRKVRLVQCDVRRPWLIPALLTATLAAVVALPGWVLLDSTIGHVSVATAAILIVTLTTLKRRKVPHWELRAGYHDREVTLYSSLDITTFNQVTRGLRRAVESSRTTHRPQRMAAA